MLWTLKSFNRLSQLLRLRSGARANRVASPNQLASEKPYLQWMQKDLQLYPQVEVSVAGQFSPLRCFAIDPILVARIKSAYRLAMETFVNAGSSPWTAYAAKLRPIHESLLDPRDDETTRILSDPISTDLFYGFYSLAKDLNIDESSPDGRMLGEWSVKQIFGCLIRLAEAVGAIRLWNPEAIASPGGAEGDAPAIKKLLAVIDTELGITVDFPNPFPKEFGLPSERGIISYRALHAVYQGWRARELLRRIDGRRLLEIGAGMGRTAYYAKRFGIPDITLVDLPLANVAQAAFLGSALGPDAIWLPGEPVDAQTGRIRICPPDWLGNSNEGFDLVLNADSMTEMDQDHAVSYFRHINRRAALFLSINQESYPLRVCDLPAICGIDAKSDRHPYWMRKGYVEEIFYLTGRRS